MATATTPQLTREAFDALSSELHTLITEGRPRFAQMKQEARANGPLTENADYWAVTEDEDKAERRIAELQQLLHDAEVLDVDDTPAGLVRAGSLVTIDFGGGDQEAFLLATRYERPGTDAEICTPDSPMGQALIGAQAGETVTFTAPAGTSMTVTVVDVAG